MKAWRWIEEELATANGGGRWNLCDGQGRERATIWKNVGGRFTWQTWDASGTGGENAEASTLNDAKRACLAAIVVQGWAPGGWRIEWEAAA